MTALKTAFREKSVDEIRVTLDKAKEIVTAFLQREVR
jgi:hypothetical protein